MKTILIILFLLTTDLVNALAQSEFEGCDLIICKDSATICDQSINKFANGRKEGKWIYFIITVESGLVNDDPNSNGRSFWPLCFDRYVFGDSMYTESYLKNFPYDAMHIAQFNPPRYYQITSTGNYSDNLKTRWWKYFFEDGTSFCNIFVQEGIPIKDFTVYRSDGNPDRIIKIIGKWKFLDCKYSGNEFISRCDYTYRQDYRFIFD